MPIEIRELHIKLFVSEQETPTIEPQESQDERDKQLIDQEMLIARCVEEVLEILNRRKER